MQDQHNLSIMTTHLVHSLSYNSVFSPIIGNILADQVCLRLACIYGTSLVFKRLSDEGGHFSFGFHIFCFRPDICSVSSAGIGGTANNVAGIDSMSPSSKEDFVEFEKLLKEKIIQFEKSVHYCNFLDSLFQKLCISCKYCHLYHKQFINAGV